MQADDLPSTTIDTPFDAALSERYLVYALSTITARSLPDVRDGLKPVHRRLLWAMRLVRLDPAGAYKKSALAVGMATSIPPHNVSELIEAANHLIDNPKAEDSAMMDFVSGPDFPTGGVLVDSRESIANSYATGRGSFRLRARVEVEKEKGGGWHLLVSEIPYGVQKSKLIEQIAQLIADKKLPILADVKDESD